MNRVLVVTLLVLSAGCDTQELQLEFEAQAFAPPQGFTRTTVTGESISVDEDDWRTAPAYQTRIEIDPAFPNPPGNNPTVTVPIKVRGFNTVQGGLELVVFDADRLPRRLDDIRSARDPGAYVFKFVPTLIGQSGLVRVFIVDPLGELVSYGDMQLDD